MDKMYKTFLSNRVSKWLTINIIYNDKKRNFLNVYKISMDLLSIFFFFLVLKTYDEPFT